MSCWSIAAAKAPCDCGALPTFSTLGELCPLGDGSDFHWFGLCDGGAALPSPVASPSERPSVSVSRRSLERAADGRSMNEGGAA